MSPAIEQHNWERLLAIGVCLFATVLVGWAWATRPEPGTVSSEVTRAAQQPPVCSAAPEATRTGPPVTCRTRSATLRIAGSGAELPLGDVTLRVADLRVTTDGARLRLNVDGRPFRAAEQTYLTVGGRRINGIPGFEPRTDVLFPLTPSQRERLERGAADLAVRTPRTPVIGVMRLEDPAV
jgi:hypothetical protein